MSSNGINIQDIFTRMLIKAKSLYRGPKEEERGKQLIQHIGDVLKKATKGESGQDYYINSFYRKRVPDLVLQNPNGNSGYVIELKILKNDRNWSVEEAFSEIYLLKIGNHTSREVYKDKRFLVLIWNELDNQSDYNWEEIAKNLLNVHERGLVECKESTNPEDIGRIIASSNFKYAYLEVLQDRFRIATWKPFNNKG